MLLVMAATVLIFILYTSARKRERRERHPFPDDLRVMRSPGESQRRVLEKLNEDLPELTMFGSVMVILIAFAPMALAHWLGVGRESQLWAILAGIILLIGGTIILIRKLFWVLKEIRNRRLGYFGERVVAEVLDGLRGEGYMVLHDVPLVSAKKPYNIDHVVIGSTGVFAVETKSYRKRIGRPGFKSHIITFAGDKLIFPWGESRKEVEGVRQKAKWLEEKASMICQIQIQAQPVLVFPGWYVESNEKWPMAMSHKQVNDYIRRQRKLMIGEGQRIALETALADLCRDAEF